MSIYQELKDAGVPLDHHESDLYALLTVRSREIVQHYEFSKQVKTFRCQTTGDLWYDIPFAYEPWWNSEERSDKWGKLP